MVWLWLLVAIVTVSAVIDLRTRTVPHWVWISTLVVATARVATGSLDWRAAGWGLLVGIAFFTLAYAVGGFGGGDVKLLGALGAALGLLGFVNLLVYVAISGGLLALIAIARKKEDFPYVPAIAIGLLIYMWRHGA